MQIWHREIALYKKRKFFIKDFFGKCDQILRRLRIWSYLLKKSLMEKIIFCAVLFNKVMRSTFLGREIECPTLVLTKIL